MPIPTPGGLPAKKPVVPVVKKGLPSKPVVNTSTSSLPKTLPKRIAKKQSQFSGENFNLDDILNKDDDYSDDNYVDFDGNFSGNDLLSLLSGDNSDVKVVNRTVPEKETLPLVKYDQRRHSEINRSNIASNLDKDIEEAFKDNVELDLEAINDEIEPILPVVYKQKQSFFGKLKRIFVKDAN